MENDKYFGDLHVGCLVDGFGRAEDVPALIVAGVDHLVRRGIDLIVANWSHAAWIRKPPPGLPPLHQQLPFLRLPRGAPLLDAPCPLADIHLSRGDNDGTVHLIPPEGEEFS